MPGDARTSKNLGRLLSAGLPVIFFLVFLARNSAADPDLWGYLAFGRLFWTSASFPFQDPFTYTPTLNLWVYHEWLTGTLLYPLYQRFGGPILQVIRYGLALGAFFFVLRAARERQASGPATMIVGLMVAPPLALSFNVLRAQNFTYLFFALTLFILERTRREGPGRQLGVLVLLFALWGNMHGGFVSGLGLLCLYALGEALSRRPFRPYLLVLGLSLLATLINPYGLSYWSYLLSALSLPRPDIGEWHSFIRAYQGGLQPGSYFLFVAVLILLALLLPLWAKWRELSPMFVLGVTLILGIEHVRHLAFFFLAAAAYLPALFTRYLDSFPLRPRLTLSPDPMVTRLLAAGAALLTLVLLVKFFQEQPFALRLLDQRQATSNSPSYPLKAVDFIRREGLSGKLLVHFTWGEYLIWELYPQCQVALDGRYETVYPDQVSKEYFDFLYSRRSWRTFLEKYPPDLILLDKRFPIYRMLKCDPGWVEVFAHGDSALFRKRPALSPG